MWLQFPQRPSSFKPAGPQQHLLQLNFYSLGFALRLQPFRSTATLGLVLSDPVDVDIEVLGDYRKIGHSVVQVPIQLASYAVPCARHLTNYLLPCTPLPRKFSNLSAIHFNPTPAARWTRRAIIFKNCGIHSQNSPWSLGWAKSANCGLHTLELSTIQVEPDPVHINSHWAISGVEVASLDWFHGSSGCKLQFVNIQPVPRTVHSPLDSEAELMRWKQAFNRTNDASESSGQIVARKKEDAILWPFKLKYSTSTQYWSTHLIMFNLPSYQVNSLGLKTRGRGLDLGLLGDELDPSFLEVRLQLKNATEVGST
ncbi:hypothetical protein B0H16DRAFT_1698327 [Mycena metata]|uniref:Uncharacterized protein n=1 Tax=Mycena metata TaxID=1033252 RepID=A0AAD7HPW2_9AGAR|nr:hypothetical protein B0H16DRAFT_1698327 [Mycena metata]